MLYNFQRKLCRHFLVGSALFVAAAGFYACSDGYDLNDEQPSGLNSIYGYMQDNGNFTTFLQLIDDLGQTETLSKTGSKTLFIADDDAFADFFNDNQWGVKCYADLSLAQKKMLLNSAMIDNPYPTSMLSSAQGPVKGEVCRRTSSQSVYDSIQVIYRADFEKELPANDAFNDLLWRDSIVLFKDASGASPMIHFTPKFITENKLQSTDIDFLYNDAANTRQPDDVYINSSKIINDNDHMNIFCKNGFLHIVDKVITPLDNMAEVIRKDANTSIYSDIVERFAVPMDSDYYTKAYNQNKGTEVDTVFIKRYFSNRSAGSTDTKRSALALDRKNNPFDASLKFDPGWNTYVAEIPSNRVGMMEDMAVMLVPSDQALQTWWDSEGKVIQNYYAPGISNAKEGIPYTPNSVIAELVNVNMLNSFVSSLPSRFADVLNDANEPLGITTDDVDYVKLGCNGAVYVTNKVFAPTSFSSVLFPAVIDGKNFNIVKQGIDILQYDAYLNSMVSTYSFFLPTNKGMLSYVDPVSYGQTKDGKEAYIMWEFSYDSTAVAAKRVIADIYNCQLNDDGTWEKVGDRITQVKETMDYVYNNANSHVGNRMEDLLDNIIVLQAITPGKTYYKTKGNNYVKIGGNVDVENQMTASGSWQDQRNQPLSVKQIYPMKNGKTYVLDGVLMGTSKSVCARLAEHPEFSDFLGILQACGAVSLTNTKDSWVAGDQTYGNLISFTKSGSKTSATYLLNSYHYTIYAPTNDAMQEAYAKGLPSLDDLEAAQILDEESEDETTEHQDSIKALMLDFVKYHIQDNSIFVDEGFDEGNYESGKTELIASVDDDGNPNGKYSPGRPYKIYVNPSSAGITVRDNAKQTIKIDPASGLCNIYAREYWYAGTSVAKPYTSNLDNSSCAVIHAVSKPLLYNYPSRDDYSSDEDYQKALIDPDKNQFVYKDRVITNNSSVKNSSPRNKAR